MFDIHCHILCAVDDGAGNLRDSVEMAELAVQSGTRGLIATPHCNIPGLFDNYWSSELADRFIQLRQEIKARNIPLDIYMGQEVFLSRRFEERLDKKEFITLNNSRYMLVEFDFRTDEASAVLKLQKLISNGYVPIVAHPERYCYIIENPQAVKNIRSLGALVQVNRGSVAGDFGVYIKKTAETILKNSWADFVASDAHSQYSRTTNLADINEWVCENLSYDYADELFTANPLKVIKNEAI